MKTIKYKISMISILCTLSLFNISCDREKDEEENAPEVMFKSGASYTSSNTEAAVGDNITIGIEAEVREERDPLVKFNITRSEDGGSQINVYTKDLNDTSYSYDYTFTVDSTMAGKTETFTFTVTNRDGLIGQKQLEITIN